MLVGTRLFSQGMHGPAMLDLSHQTESEGESRAQCRGDQDEQGQGDLFDAERQEVEGNRRRVLHREEGNGDRENQKED